MTNALIARASAEKEALRAVRSLGEALCHPSIELFDWSALEDSVAHAAEALIRADRLVARASVK